MADVAGHVWLKFALNCALNPVCAATGLRRGRGCPRRAGARALLGTILAEIEAVTAAAAIPLPVPDLSAYVLDHARTRYNRPSMLQHVEAGLTPELAALNEALVARGARHGIDAPANRALAQLVHAVAERHPANRDARGGRGRAGERGAGRSGGFLTGRISHARPVFTRCIRLARRHDFPVAQTRDRLGASDRPANHGDTDGAFSAPCDAPA
ncbi:MAG: hypothetical protein AcusKO_22800 [Acuticoccus sp.]